ncbi:arsenate-mycothiol transferase ArsC [Promicromonospora soli]
MMVRDIEHNTSSQLRRTALHAFDFYQGAIPLERCEAVVHESYELLGRRPVDKRRLLARADRWSIERLRRIGILDRQLSQTAPEILFVDTDDSGVAAAATVQLGRYARDRLHANSAGISPAAELNPALVQIAAELDIDLADAFPKSVTSEAIQVADLVITLGEVTLEAGRVNLADHQVRHWDLPGVTDRSKDGVRGVLSDLDRRVLRLLADLLTPDASADFEPGAKPGAGDGAD